MPSSHDYIDHDNKDGDDDDYVLPATTRCSASTTPKVRTSSVSDAGLNSMIGNLPISPCGSANWSSRGPVHAEALHNSHDLYPTIAKFANIYALDPDNQVTQPPSMRAFYVDGCKVKDANTKIDKLFVAMQIANLGNIEYATCELSNDQKSILVKAPDICPWIANNQEIIAPRLAKELNPTTNNQAKASVFISSIAARHSGAPSHLSSQDSITDVAMKTTTLILPPHLAGSNQFFNDGRWRWCVHDHLSFSHSYWITCHLLSHFILSLGRIDKSDGFQLQPYIFVHSQNFNEDTLRGHGFILCGTQSTKHTPTWYKTYAIVGVVSIPT